MKFIGIISFAGAGVLGLAGCGEPAVRTETSTVAQEAAPACCAEPTDAAAAGESAVLADPNSGPGAMATPWLDPAQRSKAFPFSALAGTPESQKALRESLTGKPFALSFVYTRCENPNKCPLVADTMGRLQASLAEHNLQQKAGLVLVTYVPERDSPAEFERYGRDHGIQSAPNTWLVRPDPDQKREFFKALNASVNFSGTEVNIHGIQLLLFDAQSRFVRSYHSLIWDNPAVVADLQRLIAER